MKDRQLSEKAEQYTRLQRSLADVKETADISDYQNRVTKLGADVTTTKNLYEVFAKVRQPSSSSGKKLMPNNSGVSPMKRIDQFS